jgi:hypothetical protein
MHLDTPSFPPAERVTHLHIHVLGTCSAPYLHHKGATSPREHERGGHRRQECARHAKARRGLRLRGCRSEDCRFASRISACLAHALDLSSSFLRIFDHRITGVSLHPGLTLEFDHRRRLPGKPIIATSRCRDFRSSKCFQRVGNSVSKCCDRVHSNIKHRTVSAQARLQYATSHCE